MRQPLASPVLPLRDGVGPSCVVLPSAGQGSVLDFLARRLPAVSRNEWQARMLAGEVVDEHGVAVMPTRAFAPGLRVYYYRSNAWTNPQSSDQGDDDGGSVGSDGNPVLPNVPDGIRIELTLPPGRALNGVMTVDWVNPLRSNSRS